MLSGRFEGLRVLTFRTWGGLLSLEKDQECSYDGLIGVVCGILFLFLSRNRVSRLRLHEGFMCIRLAGCGSGA